MSPSPEPSDASIEPQDRLIHCSAERTLVARTEGSQTVLVKLFESGSILDAEQEASTAKILTHPKVVGYRSGGLDPVTRKPCVIMDYCPGETWESRVSRTGPPAPEHAAALAAQLAEVLADFHALRTPEAPRGMVHGDLKPANLLIDDADRVTVMDLEHATPVGMGAAGGHETFTGGTHGYAPPEAYRGALPDSAFDVFALGATLFSLLTGTAPFTRRTAAATIEAVRGDLGRPGLLRGLPQPLRQLVTDCLSADPTRRPTAAIAAATLRELAAGRPSSEALGAIYAGSLETARGILDDESDTGQLRELLTHRQSWQHRLGPPPTPSKDDLLAHPERFARTATSLRLHLRRFPAAADALNGQRTLAGAVHEFLSAVPPRVQKTKMDALFEDGRALLELAERAVAIIPGLPGGLNKPAADAGALPGLLLRNPGQLLAHARRDLEGTAKVHERLAARLQEAEAKLQLGPAREAVTEFAAIYGGASRVAAPLKDRLLRLEFYLDRLARAPASLTKLQEQLDLAGREHELDLVTEFSARCAAEQPAESALQVGTKGRVRGLQDAMRQLVEDFPHAEPTIAAPNAALRHAMAALTDLTWTLLEESELKLDAVPIPIRPVQKLLNRLDSIRMLEALVDLPDRNRESLHDRIERCRMLLDQARNTRDNLARGAEAAMERGHLTTALYDMARAVDRFEEADGEEPDSRPLAARLEEAKRRKQSLENHIVENQQLATSYMELLDADSSTLEQREAVLERRAAVLNALIETLGEDKGQHYISDLRDVLFHRVQILTEVGEQRLRQGTTPETRLEAVRSTLETMHATTAQQGIGSDLGGRIRRLFDQWQQREQELQEDLRAIRMQQNETAGRRRRLTWVAVAVLGIASIGAVGTWQVVQARATAAPTIEYQPLRHRLERTGANLRFPFVPAFVRLNGFLPSMRAANFRDKPTTADLDLAGRGEQLLEHLDDLADTQKTPDAAWAQGFTTACSRFDHALVLLDERIGRDESWHECLIALRSFGRDCHLAGVSLAATSAEGRALIPKLLTAADKLRQIDLTPADQRKIRRVLEELPGR